MSDQWRANKKKDAYAECLQKLPAPTESILFYFVIWKTVFLAFDVVKQNECEVHEPWY